MRRSALAAAALLLASTPAWATGEIYCTGEGVNVHLLVGRAEALSVLRATVTIGDKSWSSQPNAVPGMPIALGQAFEGEGRLLVDLTDEPAGEIIARLRAFSLDEGDHFASGGVFSFRAEGAFVVDCSERG